MLFDNSLIAGDDYSDQGDGRRAQRKCFGEHPRADSLQGGVTAERAWWDLTHYHLQVAVNIENRSLSG